MDELEKEHLLDFYDKLYKQFGDSPKSLRWTKHGQESRYRMMLGVSNKLDGATVLDYGCGMGGLYGFIKEQGIKVTYTGIDINPNFIKEARKKFPEAEFREAEILEQSRLFSS